MDPREILRKAEAVSDSSEAYSTRKKSVSVSFENNRIKDASSSDLGGIAVRLVKGGRIGFSSSNKPGDGEIAERAANLAQFGKSIGFEFAAPADVQPFNADDEALDAVGNDEILSRCENAVEQLKRLGEGVLAFSGIEKDSTNTRILTSKGLDVTQKHNSFVWYCGVTLTEEGNFIQVYDYKIAAKLGDFAPLIRKTEEYYRLCSVNTSVPTGKYRVLFTPSCLKQLLMVFKSCLSGKMVAKGISPWADKLGHKLFDERVSYCTDLVAHDAPYRIAYDDEGIPTGKRVLIENGVINSFYHNLDSAAECKQAPTGHGFRGGAASLPAAQVVCERLSPGNGNLADMKGEAQIYVDSLLGAMMSNPFTGIINGNIALGFTVENGKCVARVKDIMCSVNVFEAFRDSIISFSKETEVVGDSILPYALLEGVSLSS